jgi:hypothetical protein
VGIIPLVLAAYMSQVLRNNYTTVAEVAPSFPLVALADLASRFFVSYTMADTNCLSRQQNISS